MRVAARLRAVGLVGCSSRPSPSPGRPPRRRPADDPALHDRSGGATAWTDTVLVDRFDPAIGDLTGVDIEIAGVLEATAHVENTADAPVSRRRPPPRTSGSPAPARPGPSRPSPACAAPPASTPYDGTRTTTAARAGPATTTPSEAALASPPTTSIPSRRGAVRPPSTADRAADDRHRRIDGPPYPALDVTAPGRRDGVGVVHLPQRRAAAGRTDDRLGAGRVHRRPRRRRSRSSSPTSRAPPRRASSRAPPGPDDPGGRARARGSVTLGPTGDGPYAFAVRATDAIGNVNEAATRASPSTAWRPPPALPYVASSARSRCSAAGRSRSDPGATARCSLDGPAPAPCTSPFTVDLVALPDGSHTLTCRRRRRRQRRPAGSVELALDRRLPSPPTVTAPPDHAGTTPRRPGRSTWAPAPPRPPAPSTAPRRSPAEPLHRRPGRRRRRRPHLRRPRRRRGRQPRACGHRALPPRPRRSPARRSHRAPHTGNDPTPELTFSGEARGHHRVSARPRRAWSSCARDLPTRSSPGSDGVHVLTARAIDAAGNVGPEATSTYPLDTAPPPAPTFSPAGRSEQRPPADVDLHRRRAAATPPARSTVGRGSRAPLPTADLTGAADGQHTVRRPRHRPVGNTGPAPTPSSSTGRRPPRPPSPGHRRRRGTRRR